MVTDGYQVYHKLGKERQDLKISGCWIHCKRPFVEFIKSVASKVAKGSIAAEAYSMITEIMHLDNGFDDLSNKTVKNSVSLSFRTKSMPILSG